MKLFDEGVMPDEVLMHPRHHVAQHTLVELIEQLRACSNVDEGYAFQQVLLKEVLAVEEDRNALSWAVKRMHAGKSPQAGAPEPQCGLDPAAPETWQLEHDVCERVARQYRCVGDALAWRVFGFERRYILALCRNQSPGVMAGKEGLVAEQDRVERAWWEDGRFALLHDLTNCLRIGDVTVFGGDRPVTLEVKKDAEKEQRSTAQTRRIKAAQQALRGAASLPGDNPRERLHELDVPFKTHLELLALGTERAARDGIFAARVPGDRALLVADLYGCNAQGWTEAEFCRRLERQFSAARRRAGIDAGPERNVHATSLDSVSRDPLRVPFAAYPLHPVACARLIGDITVFTVETSGPALAAALRAANMSAEWVRPQGTRDLVAGEVVMEMTATTSAPSGQMVMDLSRTLQLRRSELDRYLIELIEQDTWIEGLKYLLASPRAAGRPWPYYRDEHEVWE
jgi:hypothetical protein